MCRVGGKKRHETSVDGTRKVCMKKVTFSEMIEVIEYEPAELGVEAGEPETPTKTLARKRGRPKLAPEEISPLEQQEKRMKSAKEKFYSEQFGLACKIIELHCRRAFDDHPSTVARLRERLDARAKGVVELQMDAERAETQWELARRVEAAKRRQAEAEAKLEAAEKRVALCESLERIEALCEEAYERIEEQQIEIDVLEEEIDKLIEEMHGVEVKAAQAEVAAARKEAKKAREHELRMYGIL